MLVARMAQTASRCFVRFRGLPVRYLIHCLMVRVGSSVATRALSPEYRSTRLTPLRGPRRTVARTRSGRGGGPAGARVPQPPILRVVPGGVQVAAELPPVGVPHLSPEAALARDREPGRDALADHVGQSPRGRRVGEFGEHGRVLLGGRPQDAVDVNARRHGDSVGLVPDHPRARERVVRLGGGLLVELRSSASPGGPLAGDGGGRDRRRVVREGLGAERPRRARRSKRSRGAGTRRRWRGGGANARCSAAATRGAAGRPAYARSFGKGRFSAAHTRAPRRTARAANSESDSFGGKRVSVVACAGVETWFGGRAGGVAVVGGPSR